MIVEHGSRSGSKLGSAAGGMGHGAADGQSAGHVQQQQQQQQYRHVYRRATVDAVAGAVAGAAARTVVSPLDVIKIRFQVQLEPTTRRGGPAGFSGVSKYTGIVQAARDIVREEGIVGLWRGNLPALMLVMPYTAIQFVVVQNFKAYVAGSSKGDDIAKLGPAMSFAGGSLAGCAATIGSYPFDLLRTILASQGEPKVYPNLRSAFRSIFQTKGWTGLYAGLVPSLVEIIPYAGIQFGAYDILKRWTSAWNKERSGASESVELSSLEHFCCGLAAGTVAKVLCHPLDVVKKRFQVEGLARDLRYGARVREKAYRNMWDAMNRIVEKEGWVGLYKGTGPSVVKAAPAAAITFVVYEIASKRLEKILEEDT